MAFKITRFKEKFFKNEIYNFTIHIVLLLSLHNYQIYKNSLHTCFSFYSFNRYLSSYYIPALGLCAGYSVLNKTYFVPSRSLKSSMRGKKKKYIDKQLSNYYFIHSPSYPLHLFFQVTHQLKN